MLLAAGDSFDSFIDLVGELVGRDGYGVQIVRAYFDESGSHSGSPVLCVAGYAFERRSARLLAKEWSGVLKANALPYFHMVDCAHGNEHFSSLSKQRRIKVETDLIGIVKRHAARGFAVSVDVNAFQEVMPEWGPTKSPYAFCARSVIDEMGRWFFQTGFRGKSAYFFEAGHESRREADEFVYSVLTNPANPLSGVHYGYVSHSFILKGESPAVQAADLLAWQWATDVKHQTDRRPRRKDFESLLEAPIRGVHFDRVRLVNYVALLEEFGMHRSHEFTDAENVLRILYARERSRGALHH